jgi:hypothetical protein
MLKSITKLSASFLIVSFFLLSGCAKEAQTAKPAGTNAGEGDGMIINKPGYYEDKNIGFSLKYPVAFFPNVNDLAEGEVLSVEGDERVPTLVIRNEPIPEGLALKDMRIEIMRVMKKAFPDAKRIKIIETEMVTLASGVEANYTMMKWRYAGSIPIITVMVTTYTKGRMVRSVTSSVPGDPPIETLNDWVMALQVTP